MPEIIPITVDEALPVRHRVLWSEHPPDFSRVPGDETAMHFGAVLQNQLVSVASVFPDGKSARLRKFATLPEFQGLGTGTRIMRYIVAYLTQHQFTRFWCDARESAIPFYQRFGLSTEGNRFYKGPVPYFRMSCNPLQVSQKTTTLQS